jgi:hypothetical protein
MDNILTIKNTLILSLTLGLAPFFPEPHLWGKIKWIAGGAVGMQPINWFDFIMHGTPWLLLIIAITRKISQSAVK